MLKSLHREESTHLPDKEKNINEPNYQTDQ